MMIDWDEVSVECPLTREFVEDKLIVNFENEVHTKYVLSVPEYIRLPKYPKPWRKRNITTHNTRSGTTHDGKLFACISIIEGEDVQKDCRRSEMVHREGEGWLYCVEYQDRYIVVLVNKYLYVYMNGYFLFMDWDISPRKLPLTLLYRAESALRYIQVECEHYISLFTIFNAGTSNMGRIAMFCASLGLFTAGSGSPAGAILRSGAMRVANLLVSRCLTSIVP